VTANPFGDGYPPHRSQAPDPSRSDRVWGYREPMERQKAIAAAERAAGRQRRGYVTPCDDVWCDLCRHGAVQSA
jgi:hypothetical protein